MTSPMSSTIIASILAFNTWACCLAAEEAGRPGDAATAQRLEELRKQVLVYETSSRACRSLAEMGPKAIPTLVGVMKDGRHFVCAYAANALADIGSPALLSLIELARNGPNTEARDHAAHAISRMKCDTTAAVPGLLAALDDPADEVRRSAAYTLARTAPNDEKVISALIAAFRRDRRNRYSYYSELGNLGPKAVPKLFAMLNDRDSDIRKWTAKALGEMKLDAESSMPVLIAALKDPAAGEGAVDALVKIGPKALPVLGEALKHGNVTVRRAVAGSMDEMGKDAVPYLADALSDADDLVRRNAAWRIISLQGVPKEGLPAVVDSLRYMHAQTDAAKARRRLCDAARVLTRLGDEGFEGLAKAARSSDPGVRSAVAEALDECGVKAVPILITLARDPDSSVRDAAVDSLGDIGPAAKEALPVLRAALHDPGGYVAERARYALSQMGPDALPDLVPLLKTSDPKDRRRILGSLENMGPAAVPVLLEAQLDVYEDVHKAATSSLKHIGEKAVPLFLQLQQDADNPLGYLAFEALVEMGGNWHNNSGSVMAQVVRALREGDRPTRRRAVLILGEMLPAVLKHLEPETREYYAQWRLQDQGDYSPFNAVWTLGEALTDPDPGARFLAVDALRRLGTEAKPAVPALVRALDDQMLFPLAADALAGAGPAAKPAIPRLVELLGDDSRRNRAAEILGAIGPEAIPPLLEAIESEDLQVRDAAVYALGKAGQGSEEAVAALAALVKSDDPAARLLAFDALGSVGPTAVPALVELFGDRAFPDRCLAAMVLARMGEDAREAVAPLCEALNEDDPQVQVAAARALAGIGAAAEAAVPALEQACSKVKGEARLNVGWALWRIKHHPWGPQLIVQTLSSDDPRVRLQAAVALSRIGQEVAEIEKPGERQTLKNHLTKAVSDLANLLDEKDPELRMAAASALGYIGPEAKPAVPALIALLREEDDESRAIAAFALGGIGTAAGEAIPALEELLRQVRGETRAHVGRALWRIARHKWAVPVLSRHDQYPMAEARMLAVAYLGEIAAEEATAVSALIESLKDEDEAVRLQAAAGLSHVTSEPAKLADKLARAFQDEDPEIRRRAARELLGMRPDQERPVPLRHLIGALQFSDKYTQRGMAAMYLAAYYPEGKLALEDLRRTATRDARNEAGRAAKWALQVLEPR